MHLFRHYCHKEKNLELYLGIYNLKSSLQHCLNLHSFFMYCTRTVKMVTIWITCDTGLRTRGGYLETGRKELADLTGLVRPPWLSFASVVFS